MDGSIREVNINKVPTIDKDRGFISAKEIENIDQLALSVHMALKHVAMDRELKLLLDRQFPEWADDTPEGRDKAFAIVMHRLNFKPAWIARFIKGNPKGVGEGDNCDIQYLNDVVRKVCASKGEDGADDPKAFCAPFLHELWDTDVAVDWMIYGVIQVGTICEIWGPSGTYKTFLALDMAAAVASGKPWHNEKTMCQGSVLYIPGEGRAGLVRRLKVLCQERGLGRKLPIRIANQPVMMAKENQGAWLLEQIALFDGVPPALLIFDTLARNFGGNENSAEEIGRFLDNNSILIRELGITVLIIHHCGYDDNHARGSSALYAGIDIEYKVVADKANHSLQMQNKKMKDADEGRIFYFNTKVVGLKDEETDEPVLDSEKNPITSIVLSSGGSERAARQNDFLKKHPALKSTRVNKYGERLPLVLQAIYDDQAISDRAITAKAAPGTSNHAWVGRLRGILLSEGLIEGERFKLTAEGMQAVRIFCERADIAMSLTDKVTPFPPPTAD